MKAKLIKTDSNYYLYVDGKIIASTEYVEGKQKLFKQNCDEIFGVVDVVYKQVRNGFDGVIDSFTEAFAKECINKAMELNNKVFTLEDVKKVIKLSREKDEYKFDGKDCEYKFQDKEIIQSLQQPTEIEVEVETETKVWEFISNGEFESFEIIPKLDSNGCLILKK
jgi:hypothetical protein